MALLHNGCAKCFTQTLIFNLTWYIISTLMQKALVKNILYQLNVQPVGKSQKNLEHNKPVIATVVRV